MTTPNIITPVTGSSPQTDVNGNWYTGVYQYNSTVGTKEIYSLSFPQSDGSYTNMGINSAIYVETSGSSANTWYDYTTTSIPQTVTDTGTQIKLYDASNNLMITLPKPTTASWISSGPTVTSITVANEIASTRQFTVTHTGTLSASNITYTIDGVDITSLTSPNTPITNLQTTSTGSTFDSYTVSKFGTHSINIGEKYLNFLVASSTTNQDIFSSNNNITVNFPALSSGTYTNNLGTLVSGAVVDSVTYGSQRIKIKITKDLILMYVWIYENYNTYQAGIQSFKVLIQQWDYGNLSGNTPDYISNVFYVKPDTLYESTGSPNTLLTFPTGMLVDTYNWNFATDNNVPVSTTTSNGGGKPDRYPLIMTNLFNRNRSLYSIGMTHKDTWDLFL